MTNEELNLFFWQKYSRRDGRKSGLRRGIDRYRKMPLDYRLALVRILLEQTDPADVLLSGGLDSSLLAALAARKDKSIRAYTLAFQDPSFDESKYAKRVCKHLGIKQVVARMPDDVDDIIERALGDELFGDSSVVALYYLCKVASDHTDTVLAGDGGDEVFGGYETYLAYQIARYVPQWAQRLNYAFCGSDRRFGWRFRLGRFLRDFGCEPWLRHMRWMGTFGEDDRRRLLGPRFVPDRAVVGQTYEDSISGMQLCDMEWYLPGDGRRKTYMASRGLHVMAPLADMADLVLSLPDEYRVRGFKRKWLLKKFAKDYLPQQIINRRKRGFTCPISKWIRTSELIQSQLLPTEGLNDGYVGRLVHEHTTGLADHSRKLWLIFAWNHWRKAQKELQQDGCETTDRRAYDTDSSLNRRHSDQSGDDGGWCMVDHKWS